jgi:translation initiation factor IF-2
LAKATIRISALAKELGVATKVVTDRLEKEEIHQPDGKHYVAASTVGAGLAETIRSWKEDLVKDDARHAEEEQAKKPARASSRKKKEGGEAAEGATTAVAEPPAEKKPSRRKKSDEASTAGGEPAVATEGVEAAPAAASPEAPETAAPATAPAAPVTSATPAATAPEAGAPAVTPVAETAAPVTAATQEVAAAPVAEAAAPAAATAPAAPAAPAAKAPVTPHKPQPQKSLTPPLRKTVSVAPVHVPAPAKIQGPRVVRIEKEEVVGIRGPRVPGRGPRPGRESDPTAVTTAAARAGRGVKVTRTEEESEEEQKKAKAKGLSSRRRGPDGRRGEAMEKLKEYTDADLIERQERLNAAAGYRSTVDSHLKKKQEQGHHGPAKTIIEKGEPVTIEEPVTVRSLAAALGIKTGDVIGKLMRQGVFATVNQALQTDVAEAIALEYDIELQVAKKPSLEDQLKREFAARPVDAAKLVKRPAVVTILGHVDHGKTSLLDKIRDANVAAGEAGGITQHTAAWMVEVPSESGTKRVTFIDTPGHQAFTAMRARGANMTDVVVLVVSAAEGVQPQTIESINHAKAAGVQLVVAMNKIDRVDANPDMILGQLAKEGVNASEWGGDTDVVRTSATTGAGIKELIEVLDYKAELLELKTDPTAPARGMVIESRMQEGLGAVATVLVQDGTLKTGDILVCGNAYGKIRQLLNDRMERLEKATAAMPVVVSGLNELPNAGDRFYVVSDMDRARSISEERATLSRQEQAAARTAVSLDSILQSMEAQSQKEIRLIIKGDVQGSVETLQKAVVEAQSEEVKVRIIHAAVGSINESDVELADASKAVIIGFNVAPEDTARGMAEQRRIEVRLYRVIYELLDDLRKAMSGMLEPEIREKYHGRVEVRQVFKVSRIGNIGGCMVIDGHIQRGSKIRLLRDGAVVVQDLTMESLRRVKEDVKEVKQGFECGIKLAGYDDIKIGDVFEAYVRETIQRTL